MAKHAQTDTGQRVKRTAFASVLGVVVVIVIALPEVLRILDAELGEFLPDHIRAWLLGAAAVTAAVITAITRIMALPGVNRLLERIGLGKHAESDENE